TTRDPLLYSVGRLPTALWKWPPPRPSFSSSRSCSAGDIAENSRPPLTTKRPGYPPPSARKNTAPGSSPTPACRNTVSSAPTNRPWGCCTRRRPASPLARPLSRRDVPLDAGASGRPLDLHRIDGVALPDPEGQNIVDGGLSPAGGLELLEEPLGSARERHLRPDGEPIGARALEPDLDVA